MPSALNTCLIFLGALSLLWFLASPSLAAAAAMDSLGSSFTIEINGKPIANVEDTDEERVEAKTGSEAAIFTLKSGRLQSGDWFLGRNVTEDRSFLPKQVYWFKSSADIDKLVKPVSAHQEGDSYQLKFSGAGLVAEDGNVLADLQGGDPSNFLLKMQQ